MLGTVDKVRALGRSLADAKAVLFLGRHVGYPVALEGALKLKELAYMHAEGFAAGELKHGPIALIEEGLPVVVVMPSPKGRAVLHAKMVSNISEIQARGARTIVIAEEGDETVRPFADELIEVPAVPTLLQPLVVDRAAAGAGRGDRPGPRLRRRQAAQPRQVRHGGVAAVLGVWTTEQVKAAEDRLLARTPEGALMRKAAFGVATRAAGLLRELTGGMAGRRVTLLVGAGNNGGDALWAGHFLRRRSVAVTARAARAGPGAPPSEALRRAWPDVRRALPRSRRRSATRTW